MRSLYLLRFSPDTHHPPIGGSIWDRTISDSKLTWGENVSLIGFLSYMCRITGGITLNLNMPETL